MSTSRNLPAENVRSAARRFGKLGSESEEILRRLTTKFLLSVAAGDVTLINGNWYVTHSGLLQLARRNHCSGIQTRTVPQYCDPNRGRWVIKATVFPTSRSKGFVGYGDAEPSNVSPLVRGAEMRVAETRAVNRALRKAYGIGICSAEELGSFSGPLPTALRPKKQIAPAGLVNANGHHPLRDRLCLLIRQHQLDPALVKAYAAEFCEVTELRQASREQVATFIKHMAEYAQGDRGALLCQLNSYGPKPADEALVQIAPITPAAETEKAAGAA